MYEGVGWATAGVVVAEVAACEFDFGIEEEEEEEKQVFGGIRASKARQHGKYISSDALTLLNSERRGFPRASLRPNTAFA